MRMRAPVRSLAIASAIAISAATLTATPAQAAPVFTSSTLQSSFFGHSDGSCSTDSETGSPTVNLPVTENGPAVSGSQTLNATVSNGGDSQTATAVATATASVTSVGTNLDEINFTISGQHSVTQTQPVSDCDIHYAAGLDVDFDFVVTQPGFLDVTVKNRGNGTYTEFYLQMLTPVDGPYYDTYGQGLEFDSSSRIYLPAGTYEGYADGEVGADDVTVASSGTGTGTIKAAFTPIGAQTEAAAGKGKKFVTLPPTARDCATDTVTASITGKAKRAKMIKKVKFFVNGKASTKVKKPKKGQSVVLAGIADGAEAEVRAVVKLAKKANGKKRNPVEVTASYEACAPSA